MSIHIHAAQIEFIDARRFEELFSLSRHSFFQYIAAGRLTAYKPSKRKTLVKRQDVERLLEASRAESNIDVIVDEVMNELKTSK